MESPLLSRPDTAFVGGAASTPARDELQETPECGGCYYYYYLLLVGGGRACVRHA